MQRTDVTQLINPGDWNGDGRGDPTARQTSRDSLVLRPGNGIGTSVDGIVMARGWTPFTRLAVVSDVTGDGHPDLVGKTATGPTVIFPGNGRSGFLAPSRRLRSCELRPDRRRCVEGTPVVDDLTSRCGRFVRAVRAEPDHFAGLPVGRWCWRRRQ